MAIAPEQVSYAEGKAQDNNQAYRRGVMRFFLFTAVGILLFMVNVPGQGSSALVLAINFLQALCAGYLSEILFVYLSLALACNVLGTCFHMDVICRHPRLKKTFVSGPMQLVTIAIAWLLVGLSFLQEAGGLVESLNRESAFLLQVCGDIFIFMILARIVLPLISDYGLSEVLEVYLSPIIKPILKVPGTAVINILTSMFVSVTISVLLAVEQFRKNVFNKKEATIIASCLIIPSMPLTMLVTKNVGIGDAWGRYYFYLGVVCLVVAIVAARIVPIRGMKATYYSGAPAPTEERPGETKRQRALRRASEKALRTQFNPADSMVNMLLNMTSFIPYIIAWGTIMNLVINYTPLVGWLTYPYGLYLQALGIAEGMSVAPVPVMAFIDVVMSVVVLQGIEQQATVIKMLCMGMGQMIYVAPLLLALSMDKLTSLKEMMGILLIRIVLLPPVAVLLYPLFFQ